MFFMKAPFQHRLRPAAFIAALALALSGAANAATITLTPSASVIDVGETVTVNLQISGLTSPGSPSLGAWLADITYNPGVVSITLGDVVFGTNLGFSLNFVSIAGGVISADDVSLETSDDLNASQPNAFLLASFTFTGVAPGVSLLDFSRLELSDETGLIRLDQLTNSSATGASITVRGGTAVPDHGGSLTLLLGAVTLVAFSRRVVGFAKANL
jgi:hypothetical protein